MRRMNKAQAIERAKEMSKPTRIFPKGRGTTVVVCRGTYYTAHYAYEIPGDSVNIVWESDRKKL